LIWLVPLETRTYMELTMDTMLASNPLDGLEDNLPSECVMTDWPKLNPHSQLVMDCLGKKGLINLGGLINLLRVMPETDYGAGELEECSGCGGTETQRQANQARIMANAMTSQPQGGMAGQVGPGFEEIMTGAQLAEWEMGNNEDSLICKRDWDKMRGI
jgi:hypothetical protein